MWSPITAVLITLLTKAASAVPFNKSDVPDSRYILRENGTDYFNDHEYQRNRIVERDWNGKIPGGPKCKSDLALYQALDPARESMFPGRPYGLDLPKQRVRMFGHHLPSTIKQYLNDKIFNGKMGADDDFHFFDGKNSSAFKDFPPFLTDASLRLANAWRVSHIYEGKNPLRDMEVMKGLGYIRQFFPEKSGDQPVPSRADAVSRAWELVGGEQQETDPLRYQIYKRMFERAASRIVEPDDVLNATIARRSKSIPDDNSSDEPGDDDWSTVDDSSSDGPTLDDNPSDGPIPEDNSPDRPIPDDDSSDWSSVSDNAPDEPVEDNAPDGPVENNAPDEPVDGNAPDKPVDDSPLDEQTPEGSSPDEPIPDDGSSDWSTVDDNAPDEPVNDSPSDEPTAEGNSPDEPIPDDGSSDWSTVDDNAPDEPLPSEGDSQNIPINDDAPPDTPISDDGSTGWSTVDEDSSSDVPFPNDDDATNAPIPDDNSMKASVPDEDRIPRAHGKELPWGLRRWFKRRYYRVLDKIRKLFGHAPKYYRRSGRAEEATGWKEIYKKWIDSWKPRGTFLDGFEEEMTKGGKWPWWKHRKLLKGRLESAEEFLERYEIEGRFESFDGVTDELLAAEDAVEAGTMEGSSLIFGDTILPETQAALVGPEIASVGESVGLGAGFQVGPAAELGAELGVRAGVVSAEEGLLMAGAAFGPVGLALDAIVLLVTVAMMPFMMVEDHRNITSFTNKMKDIDGDGILEKVNYYWEISDPKNMALSVPDPPEPIKWLMLSMTQHPEAATLDYKDERYGDVHSNWYGDRVIPHFTDDKTALGELNNLLLNMNSSTLEKVQNVWNYFTKKNSAGNHGFEIGYHIWAEFFPGIRSEVDVHFTFEGHDNGDMRIFGDIDGDGDAEEYKMNDKKGSDGAYFMRIVDEGIHCYTDDSNYDFCMKELVGLPQSQKLPYPGPPPRCEMKSQFWQDVISKNYAATHPCSPKAATLNYMAKCIW